VISRLDSLMVVEAQGKKGGKDVLY